MVSAPATAMVEMNMTANIVGSRRSQASSATMMHGGTPTPATFLHVRSPETPSCSPSAFLRPMSFMVAKNPAMVNAVSRKNALMEASTPTNAPTRNDAAAPSFVRQPSLYASSDRIADITTAATTR